LLFQGKSFLRNEGLWGRSALCPDGYQFASPGQQAYIDMNAIRVGVPHANLGILLDTPCQVPPLSTQKAIAHILSTLDDKIELNRKTNETLEAMAKAASAPQ
jgi:type I restriction enzyme S subunit